MVKDLRSNEFYAMKIIRKELIIEREEILNALSERYILAAMNHPFVVKLHYAFQTKNKIYLIVDLMAGVFLFLFRENFSICWEKTKNLMRTLQDFTPLRYYWLLSIYIPKRSFIATWNHKIFCLTVKDMLSWQILDFQRSAWRKIKSQQVSVGLPSILPRKS